MNKYKKVTSDYTAGIFILNNNKNSAINNNVMIETGMFYGLKTHKNVCLCCLNDTDVPSDLAGITVVKYSKEKRYRNKFEFEDWIDNLDTETKYIRADSHGLPQVTPVFMTTKAHVEDKLSLEEREYGAKAIRLVNYAGTSFLLSSFVGNSYDPKFVEWFKKAKNGNTDFTIVLTDEESEAAREAALHKMYPPNGCLIEKEKIIAENAKKLKDLCVKNENAKISVYKTQVSLPYALFETKFKESIKNHIKVDLYSPFIHNDDNRPSFMIYKRDNPDLYDHFAMVIDSIIDDAKFDYATEGKQKVKNNKLFLQKKDIDSALSEEYRQYFVGNLKRAQSLNFSNQGNLEIGTSLYETAKADVPHMHRITHENLYVLKGKYHILIIETGKEEIMEEGDFLVIPPKTAYASKAEAGTQVLFIRSGGDDKEVVPISDNLQVWLEDI